MVHLLIVNVRIPANAQAFFAGLLSFVTFDIIELGPYIRAGLKLEETDDLTENFQNLGYQSNFFAINIGTQGMIICVLVFLLIFHVTTSGVKNEKFVRFRAIVTKGLIWNNLLTFFTESYMLMSISTVTNYTEFYFNSLGTIVSSNLCMLGTVIIFGFPLWLLIFLNAKKDKLHLKKYRDKYGEVYEHLAYRREGPKALLEPGLSLVRVLILTFTLIFLQEWRYF
jgi:magnesium-transporting ATPase (P-type)